MTDDLKSRLLNEDHNYHEAACHEAWAKIEALTAERDEALNQLDSARHSVEVLEKRVAKFMADNARLREALAMIDAIDPEYRIDGCAQTVVRGLILRMGEIARSALNTGKEPSHE